MLPWRTVGMHVPSSFTSTICVQSMDGCRGMVHTLAKQDQVYTSIYHYIFVSCCMYVFNDDLLRELDCGRGKPRLGGLSVEATEERRHAHMAEGHKSRVETRLRRKADRT